MKAKKKLRGWKEGEIIKDLISTGGSGHKKGSIVRYRRFKVYDYDRGGSWTGEYEWHYLDQTNYNLVRSKDLLIEE